MISSIELKERRTLPGDVDKLSSALHEARLSYGGRAYRVHFAYEFDDGPILLALHAVRKTTRRVSPADLSTSEQRLTAWRRERDR